MKRPDGTAGSFFEDDAAHPGSRCGNKAWRINFGKSSHPHIFTRARIESGAPAYPSARKLPDSARRMAALCDGCRQCRVNHSTKFHDARQIKRAGKSILPKMYIAYSQQADPALHNPAGINPQLLESFIRTRPETISTAAPIRIGLTCSPRKTMPTTNAPTAPMPVQIV